MGQRSLTQDKDGLWNHGILNEESHFRVHVCFNEGAIYIFETRNGQHAIEMGLGRDVYANQDRVQGYTSHGKSLRPDEIRDCLRIVIPPEVLLSAKFYPYDSTSEKGRKAIYVFDQMRRRGLIPTLSMIEVDDTQEQIKGTDIVVINDVKIQVKCDATGGLKPKGRGTLYLEVAERNPRKMH